MLPHPPLPPSTSLSPPSSAADIARLAPPTADLPPTEAPASPAPSLASALVPRLTLRVTYLSGAASSAVFAESLAELREGTVARGLTVELRLVWSLESAAPDRDATATTTEGR